MSRKIAFSLVSLITIFAFAVPSATAADPFDVTFEGRESITYTPVTTGVPANVNVVVTIKTGQSVADPAPTVTAFDKNGIVIETVPDTGLAPENLEDLDAGAVIFEELVLTNDPDYYVPTGTERKYWVTIKLQAEPSDGVDSPIVAKVVVSVGELTTNDPTAVDAKGALVKTKLSSYTRVITLSAGPTANDDRPNVVSIQRLRPSSQTVVSAFQEEKVTGAFDVRIVLTEKPDGGLKLDKINVEGGAASNLVVGVPFAWHGEPFNNEPVTARVLRPHPTEGSYYFDRDYAPLASLELISNAGVNDSVPLPTGPDNMYHQYRVTITPHRRADTVKVSIKEFHDGASPFPNVYKPFDIGNKPNGREQLRLPVATTTTALGAGFMFYLPHSEGAQVTYANGAAGHYILTKNKDGSGIRWFHEKNEENVAHKQTPVQLLYNVRASGSLPNLETFLANNGTIDLVAYDGKAAGAAYISEVMWGTDASQDDATKSQWIEIANAGTAAIGIGENKWALWFYQANETPRAEYVKDDGTKGVLIDRIGTKTFAGTVIAPATTGLTADVYWSIAGKGQSGRSGIKAGVGRCRSSCTDTEACLYVSCDGSFDGRRGGSGSNDAGRRHDGIQLDGFNTAKCQLHVRY